MLHRDSVIEAMKDAFDHLESIGIIQDGAVSRGAVFTLQFEQLTEIVRMVALVGERAPRTQASSFNFSPSLTLSGGTGGCVETECRLGQVNSLNKFAAVLADKVFVRSPVLDTISQLDHGTLHDTEYARSVVFGDLSVLHQMRPFISAGVIVPFVSPRTKCLGCLAAQEFGPDARVRLTRARRQLLGRLRTEMAVSIEKRQGIYGLGCVGPEELVPHGEIYWTRDDLPKAFASRPRLAKRIEAGETLPLSKEMRRTLRMEESIASRGYNDLIHQLVASSELSAAPLLYDDQNAHLYKAITGDTTIAAKNAVLTRHLSTALPGLDDIEPADLLALRVREPNSFVLFRDAIVKAAGEVDGEKRPMSGKDARQLYSDVVQPGLAKLERTISSARRDALREVAKSGTAGSIILGLGIFSGLLPQDFGTALAAIGGAQFGMEVIGKAADIVDPERSSKADPFYFLWKAQRGVKGRAPR